MIMSNHKKTYLSKLSVPGKLSDELSYVFTNTIEHHSGTISLFGIFHIKSVNEIYQLFIKETVKNFLDYYHKTATGESREYNESVNPAECLFENAIQYTNEVVTKRLIENETQETKRNPFDVKKVHFLIGAIAHDQLFLNTTGSSIKAFLYYPILQKGNFSHYASVNIAEANGDATQDSSRLFSNVISGKLSIPGSTVVCCNHSVIDYISLDQLKQAITTQPIEKIASYFESLLNKANIRHDFSALFIHPHYTPSSSAVHTTHPQTTSNRSMERLNGRERKTDTVLSPAFKSHIQSLFLKIIQGIWKVLSAIAGKTWSFLLSLPYEKWGKSIYHFLARLLKKKTLQGMSFSERVRSFLRGNKKERIALLFNETVTSLQKKYISIQELLRAKFRALSTVSRALFTLSAVFLLLFVGGLFSVHAKRIIVKRDQHYRAQLESIEQNINLAEGSLIYDDESRAKALLSESETMLKSLRNERSLHAEDDARLHTRMKDVLLKMSRIILIKEPRIIAKLESQIPSLSSLHILSADLKYLLHTKDGIYTLNPENGKATQFDTQAKLPNIGCAAALDKTHFYFCNGDGDKLFILNTKEESIKPVSIPFGPEEKNMTTIMFYNSRLYSLDTIRGTIYRHPRKGDGFEVGGGWIKEQQVPLKDAVSMTIDGTIFVLKSGNSILQYDSGKPKPFPLPNLEQPISQLTKIWTDGDTDILYLLDAPTKRILAVDKKNFALKAQITSEAFTDVKDFVVNTKKHEMTVLNGTDILQFNFEIK